MFMFDLDLPGLTEATGVAIAQACTGDAYWPVRWEPERVETRWRKVLRHFPSVLELEAGDGGGPILDASSERDADHLTLRPDAHPRLSASLEVIAAHFPDGFAFRATHAGSPIRDDEDVTLIELQRRIAADQLSEFVRYRVLPAA